MAGRIPQQFIDDLVARADIVEIIDNRVPLKKAGREFQACCPFHNEKTPSFTVSPAKQFYHCFGCGAHGTAIGFLMEYEKLDFVEAVEELARHLGIPVPREETGSESSRRDATTGLYEILESAAEWFSRQLREHADAKHCVDYLRQRGLSGEIARDFRLGFAPAGWDNLTSALGTDEARLNDLERAGLAVKKDAGGYYDRFRERVIFPIRDRRGRVIAFGGRVLGDDNPKYLNSPETAVFHKGRELYGLYECRQQRETPKQLLVVEGYMDTVALHQFGIPFAVATLGTATTGEHLEKAFRMVPRIVFCFDGDRAGRAAAWRALQNALPAMKDGRQASFLFLPEGEDPDSLIRKEGTDGFTERVEGATPLSDFLFRRLREDTDLDSQEGRARMVELARPLLEKLPDGMFRQLMIEQLARLVSTSPEQIGRRLGHAPAAEAGRPLLRKPKTTTPSPVRHAITLLLHNPDIASVAASRLSTLRASTQPGVDLLVELVDFLQDKPGCTLPVILENWRDQPHGPHLEKLASVPVSIPETGISAEFNDSIDRVVQADHERRWTTLQTKLQSEGLSDSEKEEWKQLLMERGPTTPGSTDK